MNVVRTTPTTDFISSACSVYILIFMIYFTTSLVYWEAKVNTHPMTNTILYSINQRKNKCFYEVIGIDDGHRL